MRGTLAAAGRLAISLALLLALSGCSREQVYQQESYVFGTRVEVLVEGAEPDQARAAVAAVLREFDRLHRMLHAWQPSELTRLNEAIGRGERGIEVTPELAEIVASAARIAAVSDQLFNPAIGKLIALWGFQSDEFKPLLPPAADIERLLREHPAMSDLTIEGGRISSGNRAVQLDLGGYAKGYALDRAAAILRARGIRNALVNIGGNVMALGEKGSRPWRVGIQHPRAPMPIAMLELRDGEAIGTSGDYQRYFEVGGKRYCHILDPRTGWPAQGTQAVTVLIPPGRERFAATGTLSDAASKPLFIAGAHAWRDFARRLDIDHALRIDASGGIEVTRALRQRLTFTADAPPIAVVE